MASTVLIPEGQTYVNYLYPDTNYNGNSPLLTEYYYDARKYAILQFRVPANKSISSAIINFQVKADPVNSSYTQFGGHFIPRPIIASGNICNNVTYNNITSLAVLGVSETYSETTIINSSSYVPCSFDITKYMVNNVTNGYFSIAIVFRCDALVSAGGGNILINSGATIALTYVESEPIAPTIISPNGTYNNLNQPITLSWRYNSATDAQQASATIEWKPKAATSYNSIVVNGTEKSYSFPANTFPQGIVEWRVKTTDTTGLISPYANATFTAIGQPGIPNITNIENKALTTISWNASEQAAFRIKITKDGKEIISGEVSTPNTYYKANAFLENGVYSVELSIMNTYNLWSNTTSKTFTINVIAPPKPSITVYPINSEVEIKAVYTGSAILYRAEEGKEFIPIAKINGMTYIDRNVVSEVQYRYYIRCYDLGYADSNIEDIRINYKGFYLQNSVSMIQITQSEDKYISFSEEISKEKTLVNYVGREYPVMEVGEHKNINISRKCLMTSKMYEVLKEIFYSNLPVIYRDTFGNKMFCDMSLGKSTKTLLNEYFSVEITLIRIDGSEEINIYE